MLNDSPRPALIGSLAIHASWHERVQAYRNTLSPQTLGFIGQFSSMCCLAIILHRRISTSRSSILGLLRLPANRCCGPSVPGAGLSRPGELLMMRSLPRFEQLLRDKYAVSSLCKAAMSIFPAGFVNMSPPLSVHRQEMAQTFVFDSRTKCHHNGVNVAFVPPFNHQRQGLGTVNSTALRDSITV